MPIYEYKCQACGKHVEKMRKISDEPLTVCEDCGGKLEKQVSRSGFQFKGEGWYVTDYANKGKPETKDEKKSETPNSSEKSSATESTAKPDSASKKADTKTSSKE
ncbi:MAG: FmdB family zinc ribbon protein [Pyrinomonadaceae bacterium]